MKRHCGYESQQIHHVGKELVFYQIVAMFPKERNLILHHCYRGQIISKYIIDPHLIDGFKYDLRIYVLVLSYDPLKIYFYYEGLVRFATIKYTTEIESIDEMLIHLTNFSVNKNGDNYVYNEEADEDGVGSKWSLSALKRKFKQLKLDYDLMMIDIKDLIIKTLIAIQPHILNKLER